MHSLLQLAKIVKNFDSPMPCNQTLANIEYKSLRGLSTTSLTLNCSDHKVKSKLLNFSWVGEGGSPFQFLLQSNTRMHYTLTPNITSTAYHSSVA
jgi:hypothetical protein